MKGVKQCQTSAGRMRKHRYSTEFKVTAVKMASSPDIEVQAVAQALVLRPLSFSGYRLEGPLCLRERDGVREHTSP